MGWETVTLKDISDESGISLSEMRNYFDDKTDILVQYNKQLDKKVKDLYFGIDSIINTHKIDKTIINSGR